MLTIFKQAELTTNSLSIAKGIGKNAYLQIGQQLARMDDATQWWIGDWLNAVNPLYGEHENVCESAGLNYDTAREYARVCKQIAIRMADLSFGHHQAVVPNDASDQEKWLNRATENQWSVAELRGQIQQAKKSDDEIPKDLAGNHLNERLVPAFAIHDSVDRAIETLCSELNRLSSLRGGDRLDGATPAVDVLNNVLDACLPYGICPSCFGVQCDVCDGRGWVTKDEYESEGAKMPTGGMTLAEQEAAA